MREIPPDAYQTTTLLVISQGVRLTEKRRNESHRDTPQGSAQRRGRLSATHGAYLCTQRTTLRQSLQRWRLLPRPIFNRLSLSANKVLRTEPRRKNHSMCCKSSGIHEPCKLTSLPSSAEPSDPSRKAGPSRHRPPDSSFLEFCRLWASPPNLP